MTGMDVKQTIICLGVTMLVMIGVLSISTPVSAETNCGGVKTSIIGGEVCEGVNDKSGNVSDSSIVVILTYVIRIMSIGIGIAATGGIVYAAILYASAEDSQEQVKKAKDVIKNVVIGIILYGTMFLLLNYLIPGGVI